METCPTVFGRTRGRSSVERGMSKLYSDLRMKRQRAVSKFRTGYRRRETRNFALRHLVTSGMTQRAMHALGEA